MIDKLKDWRGTIEILGLAAICGVTLDLMRPETWDKLERLGERIVADPAAATAAAVAVVGMLRTVWLAWQRDPHASRPTPAPSRRDGFAAIDALYFVLALAGIMMAVLSLHGCGAPALQTGAVGVTVALRAEEAVSELVVADLDRRMDACPAAEPTSSADVIAAHDACVDRERASVSDLTDALSAIELSIRAVGAGIATAAEVDAGAPIPAILLDTLREVLALWDRIEVALREHGIDVPPEIGLVVAALGALVGPAS